MEFNAGIKPIVHVVIAKSALTHTNCGKTDHSMGTCHKKKNTNCASHYNWAYETCSKN